MLPLCHWNFRFLQSEVLFLNILIYDQVINFIIYSNVIDLFERRKVLWLVDDSCNGACELI